MITYIFGKKMPSFTLNDTIKYVSFFEPGDCGCIWLYHKNNSALAFMINGQFVYPHFFPINNHPGWQMLATKSADWNTNIKFLADNNELAPMPKALTVTVNQAIEIVNFYWENGKILKTQLWTSLDAKEP